MENSRSGWGHRLEVRSLVLLLLQVAIFWLLTCVCAANPVGNGANPDLRATTANSSRKPNYVWAATSMPVSVFNRSVNGVVHFYCGIKNAPGYSDAYRDIITIEWFKNDQAIDQNDRRFTKSGYELKIDDLLPADDGSYTCSIKAGNQILQWTFFLRINYKPTSAPIIVEGLKNQTVAVGDRVVFECKQYPMPDVWMVWAKLFYINGTWGGGALVPEDPYVTILKNWSLKHEPLVISNVNEEQEGMYMCGFRNIIGETFDAAYLNVTTEPSKKMGGSEEFNYLFVICFGTAGIIVLIILISFIIYMLFCRTSQYKLYHKTAQNEPLVKSRISSQSSTSSYPSVSTHSSGLSSAHVEETFEFSRDRLIIKETIGEGAFGIVRKGVAQGLRGNPGDQTVVAVKSIKDYATPMEKSEFAKEIEVMKSVKRIGYHINIVNFLGCCTHGGPIYAIVEYCKKGSLRDYLLLFRTEPTKLVGWRDDAAIYMKGMEPEEAENAKNMISQKILLSFSHQIARGMEFLASNKVIHRDLAARNVLVAEDNILKIADFGLARNGDYYRKKSGGQIPVKWMPPEALFDFNYTVKSDVWSFGIVLWEIFSLGGMPYPTIPHEDLYTKLMAGYRMEKPPLSPDSLYGTMKQCWNHFPEDRPDFQTLILILERHLVRVSNGGYLEVLNDDT